jgi:uncharacterized membrane protein YbhN (UPF0104 family)
MSRPLRSRWLRLTVLLAISVAALAFALRDIDVREAMTAYRALDVRFLGVGVGLLSAQLLLRSLRMQWILDPDTRPSLSRQIIITAVGFMAITTLPLRLGEAVRPWMLAKDGVRVAGPPVPSSSSGPAICWCCSGCC